MSSKTHRAVIFDLDGTLTEVNDDRLQFIPKNGGSWERFQELAFMDAPQAMTMAILDALSNHFFIIILTGRNYRYLEPTMELLNKHHLHHDKVIMRRNDDKRSDADFKKAAYFESIHCEYEVVAVFEDREECVKMWRELGLTCYQVGVPKY